MRARRARPKSQKLLYEVSIRKEIRKGKTLMKQPKRAGKGQKGKGGHHQACSDSDEESGEESAVMNL